MSLFMRAQTLNSATSAVGGVEPFSSVQRLFRFSASAAGPVSESLDALVRRVDEDRWLASRFAPSAARARLMALYAINFEIARTAEVVSEPALGAIRLEWWRERLAALAEGQAPYGHPALDVLAREPGGLPLELFDRLLTARLADLEEEPFETWKDLEDYVDATAGVVMRLAASACLPSHVFSDAETHALRAAGRAWGLGGLARASGAWSARGRSYFPQRLLSHLGLTRAEVHADPLGRRAWMAIGAVVDRAEGAYRDAVRSTRRLPPATFPAVSYVALTCDYMKALKRDGALGETRVRSYDGLLRRMRLVAVTAAGDLAPVRS